MVFQVRRRNRRGGFGFFLLDIRRDACGNTGQYRRVFAAIRRISICAQPPFANIKRTTQPLRMGQEGGAPALLEIRNSKGKR